MASAAFFDLDKTVVARSSTLAFSSELRREGLLTTATMFKVAYAQLTYQLFGADEERMERARAALLELTRGWEASRVRQLIRETVHEVLDPLMYEEALELLEWHREQGHELFLVSSATTEIVRPLADHLGVPHVIATVPGVTEGRYDGTLAFYAYAENKALAIQVEAATRGIDLAASYAYSDSVTDLPMLGAVGHPIVVNPDGALRKIAHERGWETRYFRHPVPLRRRFGRVPTTALAVAVGAALALGVLATVRTRALVRDAGG